MSWYKRIKEGITTKTTDKKETPDGIWHKCTECKKTITMRELRENASVCPICDHHERIGSTLFFELLFNEKTYKTLFNNLQSKDILGFKDSKSYKDRLKTVQKETQLADAIEVAVGNIDKFELVVCCMDFSFIGGSMGSVVGEKIARAANYCLENKLPLLIISQSGGARMMEAAFSLMQMAKTSIKLVQLAQAKLPYISLLTDPTTGGVTASFAMLGDINIAEPKALIGFAGQRVIKDTIKQDLPEGFQRAEFLLEHGFLDAIVHRKELKKTIAQFLYYFYH